MLFLHAGAVARAGRGAVLVGPKNSGKTTLSLALASRGFDLLGEEIAALREPDFEILPLRRAALIKTGPSSSRGRRVLENLPELSMDLPDGTARRRVSLARFSTNSTSASLDSIIFLGEKGPKPILRRVPASRSLLKRLVPLQSQLWGPVLANTVKQQLAVLTQTVCYTLESGPPDETADLVARTLEE